MLTMDADWVRTGDRRVEDRLVGKDKKTENIIKKPHFCQFSVISPKLDCAKTSSRYRQVVTPDWELRLRQLAVEICGLGLA